VEFHCTDLGSQIKEAVEAFAGRSAEERTCERCGTVAVARPEEGSIRDPNLA